MMRTARIAIAIAVLGAVIHAAAPVYRLVDSRKSADASPQRLHKLLVIGISDDREVRHRFEDKFATHLRGRGIDAMTSYALVPDLATPSDRAAILDALAQEGVDGAMTVRAVALDKLGEKPWGDAWTAWADSPSTVRELVRKTVPVPKKKAKSYGIELALWSVESAQPLWAARTGVIAVRDLHAGVGDLLQLTIDSLKDTPWLGPEGPAGE